jgi:DNA-directed RNA polymerase subunit delta
MGPGAQACSAAKEIIKLLSANMAQASNNDDDYYGDDDNDDDDDDDYDDDDDEIYLGDYD